MGELQQKIINDLFHVQRQLPHNPVDDGKLLPLVILHTLAHDHAGLLDIGIFALGGDFEELDWLTAGIQIPLPRRQTGRHQGHYRRQGHVSISDVDVTIEIGRLGIRQQSQLLQLFRISASRL